MQGKTCPIVFITDINYCVATRVAIKSLIQSNVFPKTIIVFDTTKIQSHKSWFENLSTDSVRVTWKESDTPPVVDNRNYVTTSALVKFYLPQYLTEFDKYLYLDGDILVKEDLADLLKTDLVDHYAAVVRDMSAEQIQGCHISLGLNSYFNSGVMLINAKKCRENSIGEKLLSAKKMHPEWPFMDQHALNYVFNENVIHLPPRWNNMMWNILQNQVTLDAFNSFYSTNYKSLDDIEKDSRIIHITNKYKPWYFNKTYTSNEWNSFYDNSADDFQEMHRSNLPDNLVNFMPYPVSDLFFHSYKLCIFLNNELLQIFRESLPYFTKEMSSDYVVTFFVFYENINFDTINDVLTSLQDNIKIIFVPINNSGTIVQLTHPAITNYCYIAQPLIEKINELSHSQKQLQSITKSKEYIISKSIRNAIKMSKNKMKKSRFLSYVIKKVKSTSLKS